MNVTAQGTQAPDVSIVIVTFNVLARLRRCLASLPAALGPLRAEIVVVDNGLGDGTWHWLVQGRDLRPIRGNPALGFAAAANLGARATRGRHVLILNPDTMLSPDSLSRLAARLDGEPDVGIIGPKLVLESGNMDLASRRAFPTPANGLFHLLRVDRLLPRVKAFGGYNLLHLDPDQSREVDSVSGAFMLVRRRLWEELEGFDPDFWMYGEDIDFCFRSKRLGWRVVYDPAVSVLHSKGASSAERRLRTRYEFYRAMALFYRKHQKAARVPPLNWAVYVGIFILGSAAVAKELIASLPPFARGAGGFSGGRAGRHL